MDFRRQETQTNILAIVDRLQQAESLDAIERSMASFLSARGCDCFLISRMPDSPYGKPAPLLISGRDAAQWLAQYQRDRLYLHDPITVRVKTERLPFRWSDLGIDRHAQPEAWRALGSFRAFGKHEGLSVPIAGPREFRGYVSMAGKRLDDAPETMEAIQIVSLFAFAAVERIVRAGPARRSAALTGREREALHWIASGKSQAEVGDLLAISERTVEQHVRNARRKLGAVNTPHLVALALSTGEICL